MNNIITSGWLLRDGFKQIRESRQREVRLPLSPLDRDHFWETPEERTTHDRYIRPAAKAWFDEHDRTLEREIKS